MANFFDELKRRNVFRVAFAYLIVAWLLLQVGDTLESALRLPDWANTLVAFFLILGFPLALFFAWAYELTPEGLKKETDVDRSESVTHKTGRKLDFIIIGVLVIAVVYFASDRFIDESDMPNGDTQTVIISKSIAVLPFRNRSNRAEDAFFVDGIHDDILTQLAKLSSLEKVISRTSMEQYRETTKPMLQIGRELGVAAILEGGVQRAGDRVRINMQLIDAATDEHLWAETYDREISVENLFAIQSEISSEIVGALHGVLTDEETERLKKVPTTNLEAYGEYVLGRQEIAKRTANELYQAKAHFEKAIELDPDYALAYVGLADTMAFLFNYADLSAEESHAARQAAIDKALALDPQSGEAFATLAMLKNDEFMYDDADRYLLKALELNPNYAPAHHWYALNLSAIGRNEEALPHNLKALELDPLAPVVAYSLANTLWRLGRVEESQAILRKGIGQHPQFPNFFAEMARQMSALGQVGMAMSWSYNGRRMVPSDRRLNVSECLLYLQLGDDQAAERCYDELTEAFPNRGFGWSTDLYRFRAQYQEAVDQFEEVANRYPSTGVRADMAWDYVNNGEADKARSILQDLVPDLYGAEEIIVMPNRIRIPILAAYLLYIDGRVDRANNIFDQALETMQSVHRTRGRGYGAWDVFIHTVRGEKQKAVSALREALDVGWRENWWSLRFPVYDSIREEPEWIELMNELEVDIADQRKWFDEHKNDPLF
jgi:TolB-like protein/Tfp pilus assembly protein PilF